MKVSIITVCRNSKNTIKDAIDSVLNQTYQDIEYVIVDGASTDGTMGVIQSYGSKISQFISEPDEGIYHAMNKGICLAKGNIIGILNSDDFYVSNGIISEVIDAFEESKSDAIYGNLDFVRFNKPDKIIRHWKSTSYKPGGFKKGWHPPHPTFFVKKEIYQKYGAFDLSLDVSADFELMLRFIEKHKIKVHYLNKTFVKMRYGGESTGSLLKIFKGNKNIIKAFRKNNIHISFLYPIFRFLPKLKQFIKL